MSTLARKARMRANSSERLCIRQYRQHVSTTYIKSAMAEKSQPSKPRLANSLVIHEGETPEQAYLRTREELRKANQ